MRSYWFLTFSLLTSTAFAEDICPKYGACVPIAKFDCKTIDRSSVVTRVCYSAEKQYLVIRLKTTDYHYCAVDQQTVTAFYVADSMGTFYNQNIKVDSNGGKFDCRKRVVPTF